MTRNPKYINKVIQYPIVQGTLVEDSICETTKTGTFKTTFKVKTLISEKEIDCVYWQFLPTIEKNTLVIAQGIKKKDVFICNDVKKIDNPYTFGN